MGTRADFYVGTGEKAEWLGSIPMDGHPDGNPLDIVPCVNEDGYRRLVAEVIHDHNGSTPKDGWPWPWEDSHTTDYAYAFEDGAVLVSCFGRAWGPAVYYEAAARFQEYIEERYGVDFDHIVEKKAEVPDMTAVQNVTFGPRSGLIVMTAK